MSDSAPTSSGIPKWVWIAAIIGVILVLFLARKNTSASTASAGSIQAAPVDPNAAAISEAGTAASLGAFGALASTVESVLNTHSTNAAAVASNVAGISGSVQISRDAGYYRTLQDQQDNTAAVDTARIMGDTSVKVAGINAQGATDIASVNAHEAIVTNGQTTRAQSTAAQISADVAKYLGNISLSATQNANATTVQVAKIQSDTSKSNTKSSVIGGVLGTIVSALAFFGL